MKYLFAREENDPAEAPEELFRTAEVPAGLQAALRREQETLEDAVRRAQPRWFQVLKLVVMFFGMLFFLFLVPGRLSWAERYRNAPVWFWVCGVSAVVALGCLLYDRIAQKRLTGDEELLGRYDRAARSVRSSLSVPEETAEADVLRFRFRREGDGLAFQGEASNAPMELWREGEELYIFDWRQLIALPLEGASLHALRLGVPMDGRWNKDASPDSRKYQDGGVTVVHGLQRGLRWCCALDVVRDGETYRLLFPPYELESMQRLTGQTVDVLPAEGKDRKRPEKEVPTDFAWANRPVRPRFYWHFPRKEAGGWFSPSADEEFKAAHPVLYVVLGIAMVVVTLLPGLLFAYLASYPTGTFDKGWAAVLGFVGGCISGLGLFNLLAAWLHQYLGHIFTLSCLLLGGGIMAFTWFVLL